MVTTERIWTMDHIVCAVKGTGSHYFDKDTMRFFKSRLCNDSVRQGEGGVFFVISNKACFNDSSRRYKVMQFNPVTFEIDTPPGLDYTAVFSDLRQAKAQAKWLANENKLERVKRLHSQDNN